MDENTTEISDPQEHQSYPPDSMVDLTTIEEAEEDEVITVTIVSEDGLEVEYIVLEFVECEGRQYALLIPVDDLEDDGVAELLMRVSQDLNGDTLEEIEDEGEFARVAAFMGARVLEEEPPRNPRDLQIPTSILNGLLEVIPDITDHYGNLGDLEKIASYMRKQLQEAISLLS